MPQPYTYHQPTHHRWLLLGLLSALFLQSAFQSLQDTSDIYFTWILSGIIFLWLLVHLLQPKSAFKATVQQKKMDITRAKFGPRFHFTLHLSDHTKLLVPEKVYAALHENDVILGTKYNWTNTLYSLQAELPDDRDIIDRLAKLRTTQHQKLLPRRLTTLFLILFIIGLIAFGFLSG